MNAVVDPAANTLLEQGTPETIELLANLLAGDMQAPLGAIQIYNQKRRLPPAEGWFIDVALLGSKPFGVKRGYFNDPADPDLGESSTCNVQEVIQIDIFSFDESARLRKLDIVFALASTPCQQLAERYAFKIGRNPASLIDVSEGEGSSRLNRFAVTFNVLRSYGRTRVAQTFTQFQNPPQTLLVNP